jgi:hypothetical protein
LRTSKKTPEYQQLLLYPSANRFYVADGGLRTLTTPRRDAFETLDDLMVVVEALCPTWPPRPPCTSMEKMLL